ncbi:SRPBCC domain-containing protein [Rhodocytophaga aerolata]|uniref:SRPBCC domain-containing protein n=1 Tax=Rhodocytophaga aerolata TaxID=455078 RepID=A0ABT8RBB3_9BACT|nr:SRPBCC domain-containing protein [Rhodocytophaga aerolata]MDO1449403.1 SRPBCC domain-containing protein [Rhodocytophaga aerolata]
MKSSLLMKFDVDKENNTINVGREFAAPLAKVWAAWTQSELLDQWWAPKPWKAKTKTMDFRDGGYWLYAMIGPQGEQHWARTDYQSITTLKGYLAIDGFCDEQGVINQELPQNKWQTNFTQNTDTTLVDIQLSFDTLADLEKIIEMGFKDGFIAALENLDELLEPK